MTLMHVCKKYPKALGGDAVVVSHLQMQQEETGHEVVVVTSNCDEIITDERVYKVGLKDTPARLDKITLKRLLSLAILCFRMFSILYRERPEVIHTHSIDMAFFVSFAARFFGIPIVHTFHIVTFYDDNQSFFRRKVELWLAKRAGLHTATAPNQYDVKKLREAGLSRVELLPNGVDLSFWKQAMHTSTNKNFMFLAVGRLEEQKGYAYLIEAAALLVKARVGAFRVVIVGEGSQKVVLQKLIKTHRLGKVVTLVGRKSQSETRTLLARADAAVFPSLYETTPLTMLEAWAGRVPVVATAVGILRDIPVEFSAAYVVPTLDAHSLMKTMQHCMTDSAARSVIAQNGLKEVQKYSWPQAAQAADAIYRTTQ